MKIMGSIHYLNQWRISPISMVSHVMTWHLRTCQRLFQEMDLCLTAMGNFIGNYMNSQNLSGNCTCGIISASPRIKWSICIISTTIPWYVSSWYCFIIIPEYDGNKQNMMMPWLGNAFHMTGPLLGILPVTSFCSLLLTHWGWDKMAVIFQTTFSDAFSWMKIYELWLIFHWALFLRVQLTIFQHWFGKWLGADQAPMSQQTINSMVSDVVTLMWCQCNSVFIPKTALDCWYMSVTCWFYVPWHEWMAETPLKPH